jgi:nucleoid-associated protein YgaU
MVTRPPSTLGRSATAATAALLFSAVGLWALWLAATGPLTAVRTTGPDAAEDLLVLGAAGVGAVLLAWLGLGATLSALGAAPGAIGRLAAAAADRVAPATVRRLTAALLGTALATGATHVAHADPSFPAPPLTTTTSRTAPAPDPGFAITVRAPVVDAVPDPGTTDPVATVPDPGFGAGLRTAPATSSAPGPAVASAPTPAPAPAKETRTPPVLGPLGPAPHTPSPAPGARGVTVVRGDSLWAIAARHLGPHATPHQVAREWRRWYATNRKVIGPDPDLIRVCQVLTPPSSGATS